MTLAVMLYALALGLLLAGAAHFLDLGLRALGRPTRWVWAAAMAGAALVPPATLLLPRGPGAGPVTGAVVPLEALYGIWDGGPSGGAGGASLLQAMEGPLTLAWICASLLVILLFSLTALRLRRQARGWGRERAGGEEILVSDGLGPAVLGLIRPRIVLPPWALSLEAGELEMVLLHEAEHRDAGDPALLAGGIFCVALGPWNPVLWWGLRRLRLAVEGDCDRRVLGRGVSPKRYGRLLLGLASGGRRVFPLAPALAEGGGTFLERRLRMMRKRVGKGRIGGAVAAILAGGLFLALACETPTPPPAEGAAAVEPAGNPEAVWNLADGTAPAATLTGENVLLERISEDGTISMEAGRAEISPDGSTALKNGVRLRLPEKGPAGAKGGMEAMPLVIVDGVLVPEAEAKTLLDDLNPDLIHRIEVIKGEAAKALYGDRAADGVIQIFLKG